MVYGHIRTGRGIDQGTYPENVSDQKIKFDGLHVDARQGQHVHRIVILGMVSVWLKTSIEANSPLALESDKTNPALYRYYGGRCGA